MQVGEWAKCIVGSKVLEIAEDMGLPARFVASDGSPVCLNIICAMKMWWGCAAEFWRYQITIYSYTIFLISLLGVRIMVIREICNNKYAGGVTFWQT